MIWNEIPELYLLEQILVKGETAALRNGFAKAKNIPDFRRLTNSWIQRRRLHTITLIRLAN